jgi:regulator of sigma D
MEEIDYQEIKKKIELKTPNKIYIDMFLLNDFYLGSILFKALVLDKSDEKVYKTIIDNLEIYDSRYVDNIEYIIPELNYKHKEILDILHNDKYHPVIYPLSPKTNVYYRLEERLLNINNRTAINKNKITPTLTINTYPIELPAHIANDIRLYYSDAFKINVDIISQSLLDIDKELFLSNDEFYIYDFISFIKDPHYSQLFTEEKLLPKIIHATKRVEDIEKVLSVSKEDIELDFVVTEAYLKLGIQFYYLSDMRILVQEKEIDNG